MTPRERQIAIYIRFAGCDDAGRLGVLEELMPEAIVRWDHDLPPEVHDNFALGSFRGVPWHRALGHPKTRTDEYPSDRHVSVRIRTADPDRTQPRYFDYDEALERWVPAEGDEAGS